MYVQAAETNRVGKADILRVAYNAEKITDIGDLFCFSPALLIFHIDIIKKAASAEAGSGKGLNGPFLGTQ